MRDTSGYATGNYTAAEPIWDAGFMGVSKDLFSLAPAVDSLVSKINVTMEQLTEIIRQQKHNWQHSMGETDETDVLNSLACDWLKKNPDTLELWLVTTSTTTGQTTSTTDATTAGIAITVQQGKPQAPAHNMI